MNNMRFNMVLVPVDFSVNSKVAIKRAVALCEGPGACIHLLHISNSRPPVAAGDTVNDHHIELNRIQKELSGLKEFIAAQDTNIHVAVRIAHGRDIEEVIARKAMEIHADLIIIGKQSKHYWLPFLNTVVPTRIAQKTAIPVLTSKPGSIDHPIKTVVIPVGRRFPDKKMAVIKALRKKIRFHIRLVSFHEDMDEADMVPEALLKAYRILKNDPMNNVSYEILKINNKARAILDYCNKVNADLLIVNPESETRIGWFNTHISDALPVQSKTQVLTIQPA